MWPAKAPNVRNIYHEKEPCQKGNRSANKMSFEKSIGERESEQMPWQKGKEVVQTKA